MMMKPESKRADTGCHSELYSRDHRKAILFTWIALPGLYTDRAMGGSTWEKGEAYDIQAMQSFGQCFAKILVGLE